MDDRELDLLLREWAAPGAPPTLRPPHSPRPRVWHVIGQWLSSTIRVPVPVALAALVLLGVFGVTTWSTRFRAGAPTGVATARPSGPTGERARGELARYALSGPLSGFDAVLVELNFAPGASAPVHRHPGPILGYVVDGSLRTAINDEPGAVVPAGGTFFEPTGAVHTTFGAASAEAPVRSVVFLVVPNGSGVTERVTRVP
jgi:quercetin dioxygenase-like cupin family protein